MADLTPEQIVQNMADLDFTQDFRKRIVAKIGDKAIDDKDPEMLDKTFKALDGMDKVSLGRLKLDSKAKETQSRQGESDALAALIVTLADRRSVNGLPEKTHSDVVGTKLPESRRTAYDPAVRDSSPGSENTSEFKARVESEAKV